MRNICRYLELAWNQARIIRTKHGNTCMNVTECHRVRQQGTDCLQQVRLNVTGNALCEAQIGNNNEKHQQFGINWHCHNADLG